MSKSKRPAPKKAKVPLIETKELSLSPTRLEKSHKNRFNQLLDDAVMGIKKK